MKTSDKILTFAAIFISCLALVVSIVQTQILQKQSLASVWPRLSIGQGQGPDYYIYTLSNDGVGPAIVDKVEYNYKDTSFIYINELLYYFADLEKGETGEGVKLSYSYSDIIENQVLTPSQKINIFEAQDSTSVRLGKKYLSRTEVKITYCSIYEDCWMLEDYEVRELE